MHNVVHVAEIVLHDIYYRLRIIGIFFYREISYCSLAYSVFFGQFGHNLKDKHMEFSTPYEQPKYRCKSGIPFFALKVI